MATWKNWDEWIDHHRVALTKGSHGHELNFVERILKHVKGLSANSVRHEVPFSDDQGRNRRIDFVIDDGKMARPIAIEVDGRDKKGRLLTQEEHDDFVTRQNALTRNFLVLRFTNNQVKKKSEDLRKQIQKAIAKERSKSRRASIAVAFSEQPSMQGVAAQAGVNDEPARKMKKLRSLPKAPSKAEVIPDSIPERRWRTL